MSTTVSQLYRYPVKSMGGHTLSETPLTENGIPGDRCWTIKDEERGGIKGGKRFPVLMDMTATLTSAPGPEAVSPPADITLPDGSAVATNDDDINQRLTDIVGSPVSIWPLLPKEQVEHYLRTPLPEGTDPEQYFREVFARNDNEPLPDMSVFPEELFTYESPPGTYFDAYPLLIISEASLATMQSASDESVFDVRRFRPNIVLRTDQQSGFPEQDWVGRGAKLGSATLKLDIVCPRCVMTTHGFADLPKDPRIMRHLVQENSGNLGVYASVTEPGTIAVGDTLELL